jgi:hypothetical protein
MKIRKELYGDVNLNEIYEAEFVRKFNPDVKGGDLYINNDVFQ